MSFKGGVDEAAKMLQGLGAEASKKLLEEIRLKNPDMAAQIEDRMVTMEDLQYISAAQLVGLLRDVSLEDFGLALRTVDQEIVAKLMGMVSTGIRLDIEDGLKGKLKPVSAVDEAQTKIMKVLKQKIADGHIVLSPDGDTLV